MTASQLWWTPGLFGRPLHNQVNKQKHPCIWTHMASHIVSSLMPSLSFRASCDAFCGFRVQHHWNLMTLCHFEVLWLGGRTILQTLQMQGHKFWQTITQSIDNKLIYEFWASICLHAGSYRHSAWHGQCCCIKAHSLPCGQHRAGAVLAQTPGSSG